MSDGAYHHRSGGGLYGPEVFMPSREDVKGNAVAETARESRFKSSEIPLEAEGKQKPAPAAPVVMGAMHPRTEKKPVRSRPAHVEEALDAPAKESTMPARKPTMPAPGERQDALRAFLAEGPKTSGQIADRFTYYDLATGSGSTVLRVDCEAVGASRIGNRVSPWRLPADAPAKVPAAKPVTKTTPAPRGRTLDLSEVSTADLAAELVRRAEKHDRVVAALRGLAS